MDTGVENAMCVHLPNGIVMKFLEFESGLYYHDGSHNLEQVVNPYSFLQSVSDPRTLYHRRELVGADWARDLYIKLGRPSQRRFEHILRQRLINNCPVTVEDAQRARHIYGPDIAVLKGKTTRKKLQHQPDQVHQTHPLAQQIKDKHQNLTLSMDIFYIQGLPFLHTISRYIKFRTATPFLPEPNSTFWNTPKK